MEASNSSLVRVLVIVGLSILLLLQVEAQTASFTPTPSLVPTPAPAPAPSFVNLTEVLESAGQYNSFLSLLFSTKVVDALQNQANNTNTGITIFAPTDMAFAAAPASSMLKNLTDPQRVLLAEYHALTSFQSLASLQQTSETGMPTVATNYGGGGKYMVNVTGKGGSIYITTAWSNAEIVSTLNNMEPASLFAINQVLLPEEIFGIPSPSPAPSPPASSPTVSPSSSSSSPPSDSQGSASAAGPQSNTSPAPALLLPSALRCFVISVLGLFGLNVLVL